jgi:hypothetical protein
VWCRVAGEELVITARTGLGAAEVTRHRLSVPGSPVILHEHYPDHPGGNGPRQPKPRPRTEAEAAFLEIGDGARRWLPRDQAVSRRQRSCEDASAREEHFNAEPGGSFRDQVIRPGCDAVVLREAVRLDVP